MDIMKTEDSDLLSLNFETNEFDYDSEGLAPIQINDEYILSAHTKNYKELDLNSILSDNELINLDNKNISKPSASNCDLSAGIFTKF